MADITFDHIRKQGDTGDPLAVTLSDARGAYAIPSGSSVLIYAESQNADETVLIDGGAMTPDPDQTANPGLVTYDWADEDVANSGDFNFEVRVVLPNGKPITFPRDLDNPYMTLRIEKKLG